MVGGDPEILARAAATSLYAEGEMVVAELASTKDLITGQAARIETCLMRGWAVVPVASVDNGICGCFRGGTCTEPGGHPLVRGFREAATTDRDIISQWLERWPRMNLGILAGRESGVLVLEVEPGFVDGTPFTGPEILADLEEKYGISKTIRGVRADGTQLLFFRAGHQSLKGRRARPGLYLFGEGDLVLLPTNMDGAGRRGTWLVDSHPDDSEVAPLPRWVLNPQAVPTEIGPRPLSSGGVSPLSPVRKGQWHEVTASEPCPVCGHASWCSISPDGRFVCCRRATRGGTAKVDRSGSNYRGFVLGGRGASLESEVDSGLEEFQSASCAEDGFLDAVYRDLQEMLPLSLEHREALRNRGMPDSEIDRRGYRTTPWKGGVLLVKQLLEKYGERLYEVPGFVERASGTRHNVILAGPRGLLIPVRTRRGLIVAWKIRRDDPGRGPKYITLSSRSYGGPGPGGRVHVPLHEDDARGRVRVTEGELKSDLATVLDPRTVLTISVPGVGNWRASFPVLADLGVRVVEIAFDADARTNPMVARALRGYVAALRDQGYRVELNKWKS